MEVWINHCWKYGMDEKLHYIVLCGCDPLYWRHNDHDGVSNHQPHGCLLNRLFRRRSMKTSKLRVTGLCVGNSPGPVNSPHKGQLRGKCFHLMTSSCTCPRTRWIQCLLSYCLLIKDAMPAFAIIVCLFITHINITCCRIEHSSTEVEHISEGEL